MPKIKKLIGDDRDVLIFEVLRLCRDASAEEIARKSNISSQTIRNWRKPLKNGGTRYPRAQSLNKVLLAFGYRLCVREEVEPSGFIPHRNVRK